jgi:pimeloyl-ACP methyl ester carboxylesterase
MRAMPAVWAWTALVTSALISAATAGPCEAQEPARRPAAEPAAGIPASRFEAAGLSLVRPSVRGKIPVVLIHGLGSSPRSWAPMIEGLQADPILRENYQFWTFGFVRSHDTRSEIWSGIGTLSAETTSSRAFSRLANPPASSRWSISY